MTEATQYTHILCDFDMRDVSVSRGMMSATERSIENILKLKKEREKIGKVEAKKKSIHCRGM